MTSGGPWIWAMAGMQSPVSVPGVSARRQCRQPESSVSGNPPEAKQRLSPSKRSGEAACTQEQVRRSESHNRSRSDGLCDCCCPKCLHARVCNCCLCRWVGASKNSASVIRQENFMATAASVQQRHQRRRTDGLASGKSSENLAADGQHPTCRDPKAP